MRARRNRTLILLALGFVAFGAYNGLHVPRGIGAGAGTDRAPHPGIAVKSFDSRWIPVTLQNRNILQTLRELRLETSTMWFRIDCSDRVYDQTEIELVFEGGTVWVAAGEPKPIAPPARCLDDESR